MAAMDSLSCAQIAQLVALHHASPIANVTPGNCPMNVRPHSCPSLGLLTEDARVCSEWHERAAQH